MKNSFTKEEWARITHCVGAMALFLLTHAECNEDIDESYKLHELHGKLIELGENNGVYEKPNLNLN